MNVFYTADRNEWRRWLSENHNKQTEVWFVFPVKAAQEECLLYNDAVEEALCFGWIDSTIKHIDELHRAQRFTPRKPGSPYSRLNIERLIRLEAAGLLMGHVRESVLSIIRAPYMFPPDILDAINAEPDAKRNFESFPEPYRRIRVAYIEDARKRPEEFRKRLANFIDATKKGRIIKGFGGTDKYYGFDK